MPGRRPDRSSRPRWPGRIVAALLLGVAGIAGGAASLSSAIRSRDPAGAHRLGPWDGRTTAALARERLSADATPARQAEAIALSRAALRQDPTAVAAASTLGLALQVRGDIAGARRALRYAERLSRRDLATQVWAIEDAVGRGDIADALLHYDIALRTSRQAPVLLFPVLASAIAEPDVGRALNDRLLTRPLWQADFQTYAAVNGPDPRATARLFAMGERRGLVPSDVARAALLTRLVDAGAHEDAWRYYATIRRGARPTASRNPRFADEIATPLPFDWVVGSDAAIAAAIEDGADGLFDFSAPASVGGVLLRQMQVLPAGRYRLTGHARGIDEPAASMPYWTLTCRDGRELGRVPLTGPATGDGAFTGLFTVPAGCPVQALTLSARPSSKVTGLSGQVTDAALRPVTS